MTIEIKGNGPNFSFWYGSDEEDYEDSPILSPETVKVFADGKDITNEIGKMIYGPCIDRFVGEHIESIYIDESGDWVCFSENVDDKDFDPSKLSLLYSCAGDKNVGEYKDADLDDSYGENSEPVPGIFAAMFMYDGKECYCSCEPDY